MKSVYRGMLPESFRQCIRSLFTIFDRGDYNNDYFKYIESLQESSYPVMASTIISRFEPKNIVDMGCGAGGLLHALTSTGNIKGYGFEYSEMGRKLCMQKGLRVEFIDLTHPVVINSEHDIVICLEVAEHLAETNADQLVSNLVSGPDRVLFSAATPGQGGNGHINEQPNLYWIEKFSSNNFEYDKQLTAEIRAEWKAGNVADWFANNTMVFYRHL